MKVLVTGGTGFVGAHTVHALQGAGHDVRLLVRDPARIGRALDPLGARPVDHGVGDVTDAALVKAVLKGCDGVVHAAAMVTFDRRRVAEVTRVNVDGARNVLRQACEAGLDPVVYVSSVSALHPPQGPVLTPDSPVTMTDEVYAGAKAGGELVARELQAAGAPVTITYPGGVWGPNDPNMGEQTRAVGWIVRLRSVPDTTGGYLVIDVRDLARVHAAAMTPGHGPRRYLVGGTWFTGRDLAALITGLTGRRVFASPSPPWMLRGLGRVGDGLNRVLGVQLPFTAEGMDTLVRSVPTDDSRTRAETGVVPRDPAITAADTLRWLLAQGEVKARHLGRLA
jgi:nucleoside-diphosphate-sugar epimerase